MGISQRDIVQLTTLRDRGNSFQGQVQSWTPRVAATVTRDVYGTVELTGGQHTPRGEPASLHLMLSVHLWNLPRKKHLMRQRERTGSVMRAWQCRVFPALCLSLETCWCEWQLGLRAACPYHLMISIEDSALCSALSPKSDNACLCLISLQIRTNPHWHFQDRLLKRETGREKIHP